MAGEGLGISQGMGDGLAQVIAPFKPSVWVKDYAAALATKAKQDTEAADKELKRRKELLKGYADIKPTASVRYGAGLDALKKKAYDLMVEAIKDPTKTLDAEMAKNDLLSLSMLAKRNDDFATQRMNSLLASGKPIKNEHIIDKYFNEPIPMADFEDKNNWSNIFGKDQTSFLDVVPNQFDPYKFHGLVSGEADKFATHNTKEGNYEIKPTDVNLFVQEALRKDPNAVGEYTDKINADPALQSKYASNIAQGVVDLASQDFMSLVGKHTAKPSKGINISLNTGNNTPSTASVFNGNTIFGKGDTAFVQEGQPAAAFPVKEAIVTPDPDTFDPTTLSKLQTGKVNAVKYGSMIVSDVLDEDVDFGNGYKIPKGTPIPQGKSVADLALLYFGGQAGFDKAKLDLMKQTPDYKKWSGVNPKSTLGIFAVGSGKEDGEDKSFYTPLTKVMGAVQGGLSKDDEAKLNNQFSVIYDEYIKKGGKPFDLVGGTKKAQPSVKPSGNKTTGGKVKTMFSPK